MSITTQTRLEFRKLSARIGAEIRGLDLSSDLSDATIAQIREALNRHKALVFREANVHDDEAQVRFAARFGPLTQAHPTVASVEGKPAVLPVDSENGSAQQLAHRRHVRREPAAGLHPAQHHLAGLRRRDPDRLGRRSLRRSAGRAAELRRHPVGRPHQ